MQRVALAWLVYRSTGSARVLGLLTFVGQLPTLLLSPWAGALLDRWDRRRTLLLTQAAAMLQALGLAALARGDTIATLPVLGLALVLGVVSAVESPARQALLPALLRRQEEIGSAVALSSLLVNAARLLGPLLAGVVIAAHGEATCFLLNGLSFAAALVALSRMRPAPRHCPGPPAAIAGELREGLRYAWSTPAIRSVLVLLALVSLLGISYVVLLPIVAREALGGDARTLGFLSGATAAGAMAGALYLAGRRPEGLSRAVGQAAALFGVGLGALGLVGSVPLALATLSVLGFGLMVCSSGINTLLQARVPEDKRGRVLGLYAAAFVGMAPTGALVAGQLGATVGVPGTLLFAGVGCAVGGLVFLCRSDARARTSASPVS
jgi:MFS family permease